LSYKKFSPICWLDNCLSQTIQLISGLHQSLDFRETDRWDREVSGSPERKLGPADVSKVKGFAWTLRKEGV